MDWRAANLDGPDDHEFRSFLDVMARIEPLGGYPAVDVRAFAPDEPGRRDDSIARVVALDRLAGQLWIVQSELAVAADRFPQLRGLHVYPYDHEGEVTARVLHGIRPALLRDRAVAFLKFDERTVRWQTREAQQVGEEFVGAGDLPALERALERMETKPPPRRPGRPALTREDLEPVVRCWHELILEGYGARGKPLYEEIARRLYLPKGTVRDRLHRARTTNPPLLPPGRRGRVPTVEAPGDDRKEENNG